MASLLLLPDEVLYHIIYCLTGLQLESKRPESRFPQLLHNAYSSNHRRLGDHLLDVISLSLTCIRLRQLLGWSLFGFVSLSRCSEIDSILSYPRRMDRWSNAEQLSREFDALVKNNLCRLKISNFVESLEISNCYLDQLHLFCNVSTLKVLDTPLWGKFPDPGLTVTRLSINAETLQNCGSIFPNLNHLDLIADIHALEPHSFAQMSQCTSRLTTFNMFVTETNILLFLEILRFFETILRQGNLKYFALRAVRKIGQRAPSREWALAPNPGGSFLASMLSPLLETVMVDYEFLHKLEFLDSERKQPGNSLTCFTLVDSVLSLFKLSPAELRTLVQIVEAFRPKEFALAYGEVIVQSHFQAFAAVQMFLASLPPHIVTVASLEKAWAVADDSLVRKHYEELIDAYDSTNRLLVQKVANVSYTEKLLFSTPRFRNREYFQVFYDGGMAFFQGDSSLGTANRLWEIETSLRDLEHYCIREKKLSSIWD